MNKRLRKRVAKLSILADPEPASLAICTARGRWICTGGSTKPTVNESCWCWLPTGTSSRSGKPWAASENQPRSGIEASGSGGIKKEAKTYVFASRGGGVLRTFLCGVRSPPCQAGLLPHSRDAGRNAVRDLPPEGMSLRFLAPWFAPVNSKIGQEISLFQKPALAQLFSANWGQLIRGDTVAGLKCVPYITASRVPRPSRFKSNRPMKL